MENEAEQLERSRREAIDTAFQTFKNLRDFPSVQVEVMEAAEDIRRAAPGWPLTNLPTSTRLEYALNMLHARCSAYLRLVSDMVTQEAYTTMLFAFMRTAWEEYIGMPGVEPLGQNAEFQAIQEETLRWEKESYKRLIPGPEPCTETGQLAITRRGYRQEVRTWMRREGITSVAQAATKLAVSDTTLKSIMSDKGEVRYSSDTLIRVLEEIGYIDNGE